MQATEKKPIVSSQIEPETRAALSQLAHDGDRSISAEIRRAIVGHLERNQPPADASR